MKKLLGILVLGLLWCNVGFAKDLTGTILSCEGLFDSTNLPTEPRKWDHLNLKFISEEEVYVVELMRNSKVYYGNKKYRVTLTEILIGSNVHRISRETLQSGGYRCKIVEDKNFDIKKDIDKRLKEKIEAQEKLNII